MVCVSDELREKGHGAVTRLQGIARDALTISVTGIVQGVGFRPFVHRLALEHELDGWVRNETGGVRIRVGGRQAALDAFVHDLRAKAPPLARIDLLDVAAAEPDQLDGFNIVQSRDGRDGRQSVSPDVALCALCEQELLDPTNRRFQYPFITCTDCGPRYTVIESMPYDRERTSMRIFAQCPQCLLEYRNPADRRHHSESNSCPDCGPHLWLESADRSTTPLEGQKAIEAAADLLRKGCILAIRGLGGFHLAVDGCDEEAVRRLRARKGREAKPLAVMVRTVEQARQLGRIGPEEKRLLTSAMSPIVLLDEEPGSRLAPSVAPGLDTVGVMRAYTPLHQLLLARTGGPVVMSSGNVAEEPLAMDNEDARSRLGGIADAFLLHDREIKVRCDDSVVRVVDGDPVFLRRARGYAPLPIALPIPTPTPFVAVGPDLKNTFTLGQDAMAYVSQHIGDLETVATLNHFNATLCACRCLFRIDPTIAVRDLHPGYRSTCLATELGLESVLAVQHHHAHIAAVAAEHGVTDRVVGVAYDGTGYGDDGAVWGAEILVADFAGYQRVGQLRYARLPGGDAAMRRPWRAALGYLSLEPTAEAEFARAFDGVSATERTVAKRQIERGLNAPLASSMGRLFAAAAAVLGVRRISQYEGQAAMELEALAGRRRLAPLPFPIRDGGRVNWIMDPVPLLVALGDRLSAGDDVADLAARFHDSVARTTVAIVERAREASGIQTVALGGGVFQNRRLLSTVRKLLEDLKFRILIPQCLSPNDGAVSYGQAAVAAALLQEDHPSPRTWAAGRRQHVSRNSRTHHRDEE